MQAAVIAYVHGRNAFETSNGRISGCQWEADRLIGEVTIGKLLPQQ